MFILIKQLIIKYLKAMILCNFFKTEKGSQFFFSLFLSSLNLIYDLPIFVFLLGLSDNEHVIFIMGGFLSILPNTVVKESYYFVVYFIFISFFSFHFIIIKFVLYIQITLFKSIFNFLLSAK